MCNNNTTISILIAAKSHILQYSKKHLEFYLKNIVYEINWCSS
jgi:hypothetical protein